MCLQSIFAIKTIAYGYLTQWQITNNESYNLLWHLKVSREQLGCHFIALRNEKKYEKHEEFVSISFLYDIAYLWNYCRLQ